MPDSRAERWTKVAYRIRECYPVLPGEPTAYSMVGKKPPAYTLGEVVTRVAEIAADSYVGGKYLGLHSADQIFADCLVRLVQTACTYFYASDGEYMPLGGIQEIIVSDDEVRARIERLDGGENMREAVRTSKTAFPLTDLPFEQQRALVEQLEAVKRKFGFEFIGEAVEEGV